MSSIEIMLENCTGFQWDTGNIDKNLSKHQVTIFESEEVFFNQPLSLVDDIKHSQKEKRYYALGQTDNGRKLFIVFTIKCGLIRVISARDMSKQERLIYVKHKKNTEV